jgi:O-antigen ligase
MVFNSLRSAPESKKELFAVIEKKVFCGVTIAELVQNFWADLCDALSNMKFLNRYLHIFWLLGPFILLIERSPADIWLSILALSFLVRSTYKRDFKWLEIFWVKTCFMFLAVCLISSAVSSIPSYAFSEALAWFRFPLFAMATVFWLGEDKRLLYAMLVSTALGMLLMTGILTLEMLIEGQKGVRLEWPYGDPVSGNYLSKVGLPAFVIMIALAVGAKPKLASVMGVFSVISIVMSVFTGERINFLLRACSGMLSALMWKPNYRRLSILVFLEILAVAVVMAGTPKIQDRFIDDVIQSLPTGPHSDYYRVMGAGIQVFESAPVLGIGPATHRELCQSIVGKTPEFRCDNHPHNFYIQLLTETGVVGLVTGSLMVVSVVWAAFVGWRKNRDNVVAATAFVVPFGLFFPIQSTADFFGQWNNIFMWSAIALALAAARTLTFEQKK